MAYPQNIDPAILMRLMQQAQNYRPGESATPWVTDPSGMGYTAALNQGAYGGEGSTPSYSLGDNLYAGNYTADKGGQMGVYDSKGQSTGQTENWKPDDWNYDTAAMLAMGGFMGAFAALPAMAGTAASEGGALGAANGSWDVLPEAMGGGAPSTATMGAAGSGGASTGGGYLSGSSAGMSSPAAQGGLMSGVEGTGGGIQGLAGSNAAFTSGMNGGNFASVLGGGASGLGSLLGPAATALGALGGAQGKSGSETTQKNLPDYLKPYVTAPGGLLDSANTLMHQQMGYVPQQAQQISNIGLGLLQQPVAGNGYAMFAAKPRFGG